MQGLAGLADAKGLDDETSEIDFVIKAVRDNSAVCFC